MDLVTKIDAQSCEIQEQRETIDELYNLNIDSNQQITIISREIENLKQDVHHLSRTIARVNENVNLLLMVLGVNM